MGLMDLIGILKASNTYHLLFHCIYMPLVILYSIMQCLGNDDFQSKYNIFTPQCLDLMGQMSQLAKQDGYVVAMAPAGWPFPIFYIFGQPMSSISRSRSI